MGFDTATRELVRVVFGVRIRNEARPNIFTVEIRNIPVRNARDISRCRNVD